jgi:ADP-heptose:LPS heptosyltransferase
MLKMPKAMIVDLEVAYETMHGWHLIDAFNHSAEVPDAGRQIHMYPRVKDLRWAHSHLETLRQPVVLAPGPGLWEGRNWNYYQWPHLAKTLMSAGYDVILVGSCKTYSIPCTRDLRMSTSMMQLAAVVKNARAFIGIDSFPAHVAGAMRTPRVVLFGITHAKYILCDSSRTVAVESAADHPFTGARHSVDRISSVRLGNPPQNPMDTISVEQVLAAFEKVLTL